MIESRYTCGQAYKLNFTLALLAIPALGVPGGVVGFCLLRLWYLSALILNIQCVVSSFPR